VRVLVRAGETAGVAKKIFSEMKFPSVLREKKAAVVERWFQLIVDTYPPDASQFLKKQGDPFANPVGNTIFKGIDELFDALVDGGGPTMAAPILDQIIRIRAVQEFSPAQAVGFVFSLKEAIREEMAGEAPAFGKDLMALESRVDEMALLAFDIYMKCREKVYELKAMEAKNRTYFLLERAGLISSLPEEEEETTAGDNNGST